MNESHFYTYIFFSKNMNCALIFGAGIITGITFTVWLLTFKSNKLKVEENDEEYDFASDTGSYKLILAVRNDLNMGKGKVAAQCSHAAIMAHELSRRKCPEIFNNWKRVGQPKIVVKINSEGEMWELVKEAKKHNLLTNIVQDAGRTQVAKGSRTVLAVGPGPDALINQVSGYLKLY